MADEYGTTGLGASLNGDVIYHFCYQATAGFSLNLNWEFESMPSNINMKVTYTPLGGVASTNLTTTAAITGTLTTSLPAATFCYVKAEASGTGGGDLTTSLS